MPGVSAPPSSLRATSRDLPHEVARALRKPGRGTQQSIEAGGAPWSFRTWGDPGDRPLLLVHGVTSDSGIWWRIGPALAAGGYAVTAVDMPGHGWTPWRGRHEFADTAEDLGAFLDAAGLDRTALSVVGHSWGAMVAAHLPRAGTMPRVIVLLDPPVMGLAQLAALTREPTERPYDSLRDARSAVRASNPGWSRGDVEAKARALVEFDGDAVLAVLLQNGDWDGGMGALRDAATTGVQARLIRGEEATGGFIPDTALAPIERQLGRDHVITIAEGPHSPQRTHPEATVAALLAALGP